MVYRLIFYSITR